MRERLHWTKIGRKNVLIVDQSELPIAENISLMKYVGDIIAHSGKGNISVVLNLHGSKLSTDLIRSAQATIYQTLGLVQEVIVVADARTQKFLIDSFGRQSYFKLTTARSVTHAREIVAGYSSSLSSLFTFSNLLKRQNQ